MNKKILLLLPALAMVLAGCNSKKNNSSSAAPTSSSADPNAVTAVEVTPASKTVEAGETVQLEASVKPFTAANKEVTWSSDNETLATVNASGLVTTYEAGTVHIKATSQADTSKSGQSTLTINVAKVYYPEKTPDTEKTYKFGTYQAALSKRIFFNGEFEDYPRGKTAEGYDNGVDVKFEAAVNPGEWYVAYTVGGAKKYIGMNDSHRFGSYENTSSADTVWNWDAELKTVCKTLTDTKTYFPGTYNNYETISGCDVTMASSDYIFQFIQRLDPVDPTSVNIIEDTANVYANGSVQLHAECEPAGAMNAKLTWTVEDNEKVHVDNHGFVTADADAVPNSHATIKATFGELPGDTCDVTVKEQLNYGTLEAPLTVAQAKALIDKFPAGELTEQKLFVKGYVHSSHGVVSSTSRNDVWLTNDDGTVEQEFELYSVYADSSLGELAANSLIGKQVTATGWGKNFNGTYEFNNKDAGGNYDNGVIMAVENGTREVTSIILDPSATFDITQGGHQPVSASFRPYGASGQITWTIAPADQGVTYEDGEVKASPTATVGNYTVTAPVGAVSQSLAFTVSEDDGSVEVVFEVVSQIADPTATYTGGSVQVTSVAVDSHITLAVSGGGNNGKIYKSNDYGFQLRLYASSGGGTLTVTAGAGYEIKSASGSGSINGSSWWGAPGNIDLEVAGNKQSASYHADTNTCFYSVTVVYKPAA